MQWRSVILGLGRPYSTSCRRHCGAIISKCFTKNSCGVVARIEPKEFKSLVPDAELNFAWGTVTCDLSGVHSLSPSHLARAAVHGRAMDYRATSKHTKYDGHAALTNSTFYPLVVDAFGCMHKEFTDLIDLVEAEAENSGFAPSPSRMTLDTFLAAFSTQWQADNARIVAEWQRLCRQRVFHSWRPA